MLSDASTRLSEIVVGGRRVRPFTTLVIALVVTAIVAIPMTERVVRADAEGTQADADALMVDLVEGDPMQLDGAELRGHALISMNDPTALGVSFQLFAAGGDEPVLASQDLSGPNFFPIESVNGDGEPVDTQLLEDGAYDLFVTVAQPEGQQRTAVSFSVVNG